MHTLCNDAIAGTFNAYVELTGCTNTKHPSSLGDDTPLLHLLSYSTENESSNDLLYAVICDVVRMFITWIVHWLLCNYPPTFAQIVFLSQFVATIVENLRSSPLRESYCPESVPKLNVMEFIQHYILIGKSKKYVFILFNNKKNYKVCGWSLPACIILLYLNCMNNFKPRTYKLLVYILVAQNYIDCSIVSQTAVPISLRPISMAYLPIVWWLQKNQVMAWFVHVHRFLFMFMQRTIISLNIGRYNLLTEGWMANICL